MRKDKYSAEFRTLTKRHKTVAMFDIYLQILHSVKKRIDRLSHRAIYINTGKI